MSEQKALEIKTQGQEAQMIVINFLQISHIIF